MEMRERGKLERSLASVGKALGGVRRRRHSDRTERGLIMGDAEP